VFDLLLDENSVLRRQVNQLINEKNLLEIQLENTIAENKNRKIDHQAKVFDGEGGSLRHEYNLLKYDL
jgi:hypothetical protein